MDKEKKSVGRPKIPGKHRNIVCSDKEFEQIKQLLNSIRNHEKPI